MSKVKIYCLSDPRTNNFFYVGATCLPLKQRLIGHLRDTKNYSSDGIAKKRLDFIKTMVADGFKPVISVLDEVIQSKAQSREKYFYRKLKREGHDLMQDADKFTYNSRITASAFARVNSRHNKKTYTFATSPSIREKASKKAQREGFTLSEKIDAFLNEYVKPKKAVYYLQPED